MESNKQIRARRSAQTSSSRRRRADSRFSGRNTARRPELIEYARGMEGQSARPNTLQVLLPTVKVFKPNRVLVEDKV